MAKPRKYKRPPQGTSRMSNGPYVTKKEHDAANVANRFLYELGDENVWEYRDAISNGYTNQAKILSDMLLKRYGEKDWYLLRLIVDFS